jgi:DNA polymerase III delta subunit
MLYVFLGTDREKARAALNAAVKKTNAHITRVSDANPLEDLKATLRQGAHMFAEARVVVLDSVCTNEEAREELLAALPALAASADQFFMLEEKPNAELKKKLQKYAAEIQTFDAAKRKEYPTVFKLADYMKKGDKKNMWVAYQHELAQGNAPEAIHGVLFWGAKQMLLKARAGSKEATRARAFIVALSELPHHSRRRGEEFEYALERWMLSSI